MKIAYRYAVKEDLPTIVRMLADDELGAKRESFVLPLPDVYENAFIEMTKQKGNDILVAERDGILIGFLQLLFIPGLARLGMKRAQIEGVRVDRNSRGKEVGKALVEEAIRIARDQQCGLIQLTTDKQRKDAHRFYEKLGFKPSHNGMKLYL
ncbi:GNAT family N-acetyltransferase [Shouchella sp. 1P09AA]|uniref:GNAT family N-acetyltransferase n=1 Tax=unclassified Shouchella TaxID=2893065 RepID=UPI00399EF362